MNRKQEKDLLKMIRISRKMKEAILEGKLKHFADLLHKSWIIKKEINSDVSNDHIEDCYNTARQIGALGGKLLGAGESGYLLIYSSPLFQKEIKTKLREKNAIYESFNFTSKGIEVWSTAR